jgi:plastocyanin
MKAWTPVIVLALWVGGIAGGFIFVGHPARVANFLGAGKSSSTPSQSSGTAVAGASGSSSITLKMKDFLYDPNKITAPAGKITLVLQNYGRYTHDFRLYLPGGGTDESGDVGAGFSKNFTITLKAGTYKFDCSVSNHAKRGMVGVLVVK